MSNTIDGSRPVNPAPWPTMGKRVPKASLRPRSYARGVGRQAAARAHGTRMQTESRGFLIKAAAREPQLSRLEGVYHIIRFQVGEMSRFWRKSYTDTELAGILGVSMPVCNGLLNLREKYMHVRYYVPFEKACRARGFKGGLDCPVEKIVEFSGKTILLSE